MCKWTRISSYINTGYSIPAILMHWGTKSHGQWGGLLLDSLCQLIIDYFYPLHNSWSAARTVGVLLRDMANMVNSELQYKTSNIFNTSHLICHNESCISNNFTLYLLLFSLPHSDAHSLSFPLQLFLQTLWLEWERLARLSKSSSLQLRNHRAHVTLVAQRNVCSKFICTVWLIILIDLQKIHYCLIQVRKLLKCCPYSNKTRQCIMLLNATAIFLADISTVTSRNHRSK